jgi:hypothetical protein
MVIGFLLTRNARNSLGRLNDPRVIWHILGTAQNLEAAAPPLTH